MDNAGAEGPAADDEPNPPDALELPTERAFARDVIGRPRRDRNEPAGPDGRRKPDAGGSALDMRAQASLRLSLRMPRTPRKGENGGAWWRVVARPPRYAVSAAPIAVVACAICGETWPVTPWIAAIGLFVAGVVDLIRPGR
jgi:hypothetical protein